MNKMFNINDFLTNLDVSDSTDIIDETLDLTKIVHLITNDPWLARQAFFGLAGSMERQLEWIGSSMYPNAVRKLERLASGGIKSETYTVNNWFGTTNADNEHVNAETVISHTGDEINVDQQLDDQREFVDELEGRMKRAGIIFVYCMKEHDKLSDELDQLSYAGIKVKGAMNKQQRTG